MGPDGCAPWCLPRYHRRPQAVRGTSTIGHMRSKVCTAFCTAISLVGWHRQKHRHEDCHLEH